MKPSQSLQLRQSQSLVMTQQLQQSIKLLQLSSIELNEFVEQELEKNPLLTQDDAPVSERSEAESAADSAENEGRGDADFDESGKAGMLDSNYGDGWQHDETSASGEHGGFNRYAQASSGARFDGEERSLEQTLSSEKTLSEHLLEQLEVDIADPQMRLVGRQLINMLDDGGYLRESTDELAALLGADNALIEATITSLQRFDPSGVFARNLKECLAIQLKDQNLYDPMMARFIEHIHLLEKADLKGLRDACEASDEDFQDMLAQVKRLDPYPARQFMNDLAAPVIPDVMVRQGKEGIWQVELNHDVLPKVLLDQRYYTELDSRTHQKEEKKYLSEQLNQANWLVKAIDQRAQTILKVSTEIVRQQEHFLLYGIQFLKPLTLKDIALQVDLHESTISRVTTNKFMATPRGIFELKYFFTSSISASSGSSDISSKTVMYYIKELIDQEPADSILSDDEIVVRLKQRNIDIARRTIAKYREAMNIPSSVIRRRQKNSSL